MRSMTPGVLLLLTGLVGGCATVPGQPASQPTLSEPAPVVDADPADEQAPTLRVTASRLNVRQQATTASAVLFTLRRGDRVSTVGEQEGEWRQVRTADGRTGWAHGRYLATDAPCPADRAEPELIDGPPLSFSDGQAGHVVIEARFGADGMATEARVIANTTGSEELAERALAEVRAMRFAPPVRRCRPQPFVYEYQRRF